MKFLKLVPLSIIGILVALIPATGEPWSPVEAAADAAFTFPAPAPAIRHMPSLAAGPESSAAPAGLPAINVDSVPSPGSPAALTANDSAAPDSVGFIYDDFPGLIAGPGGPAVALSQLGAGPHQLVQMNEATVGFFSRSGAPLGFDTPREFFLVPGGYPVSAFPEIIYDALSGRWIASYMASNESVASPSGLLIVGMSLDSDAQAGWDFWLLDLGDGAPFRPQLGVSDDKVVVTFERWQVPLADAIFVGAQVVVIEKSTLLAGTDAIWAYNSPAPGVSGVTTAQNLSAGGAVFTADVAAGDELRLSMITGTIAGEDLALSTASLPATHTVPPAIKQLDGPPFFAGDGRLVNAVWRDGILHTAGTSGCMVEEVLRACAHILEVDTAIPQITGDMLFGAPGTDYFSPAITVDAGGNLHVSLSRSSETMYPEAIATGRYTTDPPGEMSGAVVLRRGDAPFLGSSWGESSAALDPLDPMSAWYGAGFGADEGGPNWGTWIAAGSHVSPSITGLLRVTTNPARTTIIIDGIPRDQWGLNWTKLPPGEYFLEFSDIPEYITPAPQWFTIVAGQTTTIQGEFIHMGQLRVITDPPAPSTIYVDGHPRNDWGMWMWVAPGFYQVCFGDVPGYVTPPCQPVEVASNGYTEVTGVFNPSP